eukprot:jgi/Phyca11/133140/e_gw1.332.4.1
MEQSRYKPALAFVPLKDGVNYFADMNVSKQTRLNITPEQLCRWMNHRAYGNDQHTQDIKPTHARSSTLEFHKKAISPFMPRLTIPWDNVRCEGNPTRSEAGNRLIKTVKRFEVRREGVMSSARRPIEYGEFRHLLTLVRTMANRPNTIRSAACLHFSTIKLSKASRISLNYDMSTSLGALGEASARLYISRKGCQQVWVQSS